MRYSNLKQILKKHKLRITDCRMDILEFFIHQETALSFKDLEDNFDHYDRVTLYRTLHSFTDHGMLHKIPDDSGSVTYGMCFDTCDAEEHHHNHIHFKCNECGEIKCLNEHLPKIELPGYQVHEANLIVNGICKDCVEK